MDHTIRNIGTPLEFRQTLFPAIPAASLRKEFLDDVLISIDQFTRDFPDIAAETDAMGKALLQYNEVFSQAVDQVVAQEAAPSRPPEMQEPRNAELLNRLWKKKDTLGTFGVSDAAVRRAEKNLRYWITIAPSIEAINPRLATYFLEKSINNAELFEMRIRKIDSWVAFGQPHLPDEARSGIDRFVEHELLDAYCGIFNLGTVRQGKLLRGGQVYPPVMEELKARNVKTIINLRAESPYEESPSWSADLEGQNARSMGINYRNFRLHDSNDPPPSKGTIREIVDFIDSCPGQVYVHCAAGIGRTGMVVAAWEMKHGATFAQALKNAEQYGFAPEHRASQVKVLEEIAKEYRAELGYLPF